jgi:hypothetical protein
VAAGVMLAASMIGAPVVAAAGPADLFISEYVEGSGNNKAIELYNGTGTSVDLGAGDYVLDFYINGALSVSASIGLTGNIAAGDVYVIAHPSAAAPILAVADATNAAINFNGNDVIVLRHDAAFLDYFGQLGNDPGTTGWGADPTNSVDNTLVRKSTVDVGDTNGNDAFDPATEWDGFAVDTFSNLGSHFNDASSGGGGGGGTSDTGIVAAQVSVPSSAACLEVSTNVIQFGTVPLGSEDQPATPDVTVTNFAAVASDIYAHGATASGVGATWTLTNSSETCADTLGLDRYRLSLESGGTETGLGTANSLLETLGSGASGTHTARIWTPCPGSGGSGSVLTLQITFLATTGG